MASIQVNEKTRFIISTSGRASSIRRCNYLLQDLLKLNIAYIPIAPDPFSPLILPEDFASAMQGLC
jgi:hypothetical protein